MEQRQGLLETAPEVWSRELVQLDADLVTMINPAFLNTWASCWTGLRQIPRIAFYPTDYSPDRNYFEIVYERICDRCGTMAYIVIRVSEDSA